MTNEVKMMRYFNGLFLKEDEFKLEQDYHIRMRRLHNRYLHSWGIVHGLEVKNGAYPQKVTVTAGMALSNGNQDGEEVSQEIILTSDTDMDLSGYRALDEVYIYITYSKEEVDPVERKDGKEIHWEGKHWEEKAVIGHGTIKPAELEKKTKIILAKVIVEIAESNSTKIGSIKYKEDDDKSLRTYAGFCGKVGETEKLILATEEGKASPFAFIEGKILDSKNGIRINSPQTNVSGSLSIDDKVGIGTTESSYTLDVSGTGIKLGLEKNGGGRLVILNNKDDNKIFLEAFSSDGKKSANELLLTGRSATNVPKLSLRADTTYIAGNVGIGTTVPKSKLEVSGDFKTTGKADIGSDCTVSGNCTVNGNLTVKGTTTTIDTKTIEVEDNIIRVNKYTPDSPPGPPKNVNGGLEVYRGGKESNAQIIWDEEKDRWKIGLDGDLKDIAYGDNADKLTNKSIADDLHRHNKLVSSDGSVDPALSVDSKGNVGIGTTVPKAKLHLHLADSRGANRQEILFAQQINHNTFQIDMFGGEKDLIQFGAWGPEQNIAIVGDTKANIEAGTSAKGIYIKNGGNVGIGTTAPKTTLDIYGTLSVGNTDAAWKVGKVQITTSGASPISNRLTYGTDGSGWKFAIGKNQDGTVTEQLTIHDNGNVGIGTTDPNYKLHVIGDIAHTGRCLTPSDLRLKDNISPLENAVEKVNALHGIYFNFKDKPSSKREVGVIAQEVETILPEAVSEDIEGYKSVDYSKLTPLLTEAIKELKAENEALKARISALETATKP